MLFEFDADQRLLRDTVREVTARECPPALIRDIVDKDLDAGQLWQTYVGLGWTELTDPDLAVELAIVLEGLGRATDPTPFLASVSQFAPSFPTRERSIGPVPPCIRVWCPAATARAGG